MPSAGPNPRQEVNNEWEGQRQKNNQIIQYALPNLIIPTLQIQFTNLEEAQKSLKHAQVFMSKSGEEGKFQLSSESNKGREKKTIILFSNQSFL